MSEIEPVTERDIDEVLNARAAGYDIRYALEQDRRRVAERQVLTHETNLRLLDTAYAEIEHLRAENTSLRTLIAVQPTPCVYCGLTEMAKCASGFPGCARADDLICGEDEAFKAVVSERNSLRAEVARLTAACAAKDAALLAFDADQVPHDMALEMREAALSDDAGKNYVDASGAVESMALPVLEDGNAWIDDTPLPAAWVGKSVLIVVKP